MKAGTAALRYGLVTAILVIVVDVVLHLTGLDMRTAFGLLEYVVLIAGIFLCCIGYSKANDGYVTFGQAFVSGLFASLIAAGIIAIWSGVNMVIWPELADRMLQKASQGLDRQGITGEEPREMAMRMTRIMSSPGIIAITAFFSTAVNGIITALIGGAVAKKRDAPRPEHLDASGGYTN